MTSSWVSDLFDLPHGDVLSAHSTARNAPGNANLLGRRLLRVDPGAHLAG
ncbi:MAG: hypothetical protein KAX80_13755 [Planctomycetes bacterium]|nr:hypothetical protein [Planctomycetota bacterium]